jgi:hypothetical protein
MRVHPPTPPHTFADEGMRPAGPDVMHTFPADDDEDPMAEHTGLDGPRLTQHDGNKHGRPIAEHHIVEHNGAEHDRPRALTPRQARFLDLFFTREPTDGERTFLNSTASARAAGYRWANKSGPRLLHTAHVRAAIERRFAPIAADARGCR